MSSENEEIADIVREMRDEGHTGDSTCLEWVGAKMRAYADRIEAAAKRERELLNPINSYQINRVGNAAAMREALVAVQKKIEYLCGSFNVPNSLVARRMEINGIINAALAAPARNCDVYKTEREARRAFLSEPCDHPCGDCTIRGGEDALCHKCGVEWLFATAEKGGAK